MKTPSISIVTPSLNQAGFLEETIQSVLGQNYPGLEYIIIDGGSTDGSTDIIRKYADRLAYWCSEPDQGPCDAINKGFSRSTGHIMAWINADDVYFPKAFRTVADIFSRFPEVSWITSLMPSICNAHGVPFRISEKPGFAARFFSQGDYANPRFFFRHSIQQESTFWTRPLWEATGGSLDLTWKLAYDFELWSRMFAQTPLAGVHALLGSFRKYGDQRSLKYRKEYFDEVEEVFARAGGRHCRGMNAFIRRSGWGRRWPLNILPSLGYIQPATNIRWNETGQCWRKYTDFIV